MLFGNHEEAQALNSECAFCKLPKFTIRVVPSLIYGGEAYNLERCEDPLCIEHCRWGHSGIDIIVEIANKDSVAIVSGW